MLIVERHPLGLSVTPRDNHRVGETFRRLRSLLDSHEILLFAGRFVIPKSAAVDIAREFAPDEVEWQDDALTEVNRQRQLKASAITARLEVEAALQDPDMALVGYHRLSQLDPHQVEAVAAMSAGNLLGLALFDEQGTGKTIMALAAFDRLREEGVLDKLLVIAPKSVTSAWVSDAQKLFGGAYRVVTLGGPMAQRRRELRAPHDILIVSYEQTVRDCQAIETVVSTPSARFMLVIDESFFVKNPATARAVAVGRVRQHCDRAILLCGTPAPNSSRDIVNQIDLMDMGTTFGDRPLPEDESGLTQVVQTRLDQTIVLRRLKDDVFPDLPSKEFERVYVELRPTQRAMYERALNQLIVIVRSLDDREFRRRLTTFLAQRSALLQICSHPGGLDPSYTEQPAKLAALDSLIDELVLSEQEKVVIWSYFRFNLSEIARRYERLGLVRIDGSVSSSTERRNAIARFQDDPDIRIFLGNAAAAGAGITLTSAHHVIYESFSNQAAHYMQSLDRVHRRGQEHTVTYHIVLARGTVDQIEFERLLQKERAGRALLGDRVAEPMTRERFLAELDQSLAQTDAPPPN